MRFGLGFALGLGLGLGLGSGLGLAVKVTVRVGLGSGSAAQLRPFAACGPDEDIRKYRRTPNRGTRCDRHRQGCRVYAKQVPSAPHDFN